MFLNYGWDRWIGLGEYCFIVMVIGIFSLMLSAYLSNYCLKKELKGNKLYKTRKLHKNKEKKIFFDVA
jgi:hypothetical protein